MIDIKELRRLAQAATPGPWKILPLGDEVKCFAVADINFLSVLTVVDEGDTSFGAVYLDGDAKFIAAANPAVINELLDRLEAAEKERDEVAQQLVQSEQGKRKISEERDAAEKERDIYKAAYNEWTAKTEWVQDELTCGKLPGKYLGMHRADGIKAEIDALRAKIEAMEKQEPVAWLHETRRDSDVVTTAVKHVWGKVAVGSMAAYSIPLYLAPGAKGE